MRFSLALPVLQTLAMIVIVWAPWAPDAHKIDIVLTDGREIRGWSFLPGPTHDAILWAQGINLPVLPAEIPIDLAGERFTRLPELKLRFICFWFFGALCWYMVGKTAEDIMNWRKSGAPPPRRIDLIFAIESFLVALLSFLALIFEPSRELRVLMAWSMIWLGLTAFTLTIRLFQRANYKRAMVA